MFSPFFSYLKHGKSAVWAPITLSLCGSPVLGLAVVVQEAFQSPKYYFTFSLILLLHFLTFEKINEMYRKN